MVEDVWYCKEGHQPVATVLEKGPVQCEVCGKEMMKIGWFEGEQRKEEQKED